MERFGTSSFAPKNRKFIVPSPIFVLTWNHISNISESVFVTRVRHDTSTSNLKRHVDECSPGDAQASKILKDFLGGSTYDKAKFRYLTAIWIARRHRPFLIAEDPELQDMFQMLCSKVDLPSRMTVSRDIKEIFSISRGTVASLLKVCHPPHYLFTWFLIVMAEFVSFPARRN